MSNYLFKAASFGAICHRCVVSSGPRPLTPNRSAQGRHRGAQGRLPWGDLLS